VVHFGLVLYWIPVALAWISPAGIAVHAAGLALFAAAGALLGHGLHHAVHDVRAPVWLALPVSWTAMEWALAHLPAGLAYPWLGLGTTLTGFPRLVGVAEVVGATGAGFWIALVNGLVASALSPRLPGRSARALVAGAVTILLLPMGWGVWRASGIESWPVARVALLQTNLAQRVRLDPAQVRDSTYAALDRLVASVPPGSADLAVAPEMLLPVVPDKEAFDEDAARLRAYARELGAPVLFGARGELPPQVGAGAPAALNSVYLMEPGGLADFRWDKHHLVPMVERSALLLPRLRGPDSAGFVAGAGWPLADAVGAGFGAMICFESAFPGVARQLRRAGADVLVNVTNDAWFGNEVTDARTTAAWQHPAHLVMRAIETRAAVVRVGNGGFSFWVDPVGRIHDVIPFGREAVAVVEVRTSDVRTLHTRLGDLVGNACAVAGLILLLGSVRQWSLVGGARRSG
jgi:apolipoprotein N-acyltransferase